MLGTPLGHPDFVRAQLVETTRRHQTLLDRIPAVRDVQSAWALLLHCAGARANYLLRIVRPDLVRSFAERHDRGLWQCLARILGRSAEWLQHPRDHFTSLSMGGLGSRKATRVSPSAYWASWADSLSMTKARHPRCGRCHLALLARGWQLPKQQGRSTRVSGFDLPSWQALADGARPPFHDVDDQEPGVVRHGWQHEAVSRVERHFRERQLMPPLADHERALLRSQSGPFAGVAFCEAPASYLTRIDSHLFRVLLLRRLCLQLPLSVRTCRCGRLLDPFGHHRASCSRSGMLGRRGFAVESAGARICRETGARVTTNMMVRPVPNAHDGRRLDIVADGLPWFGSAQLAVDTTLVSPLHCEGSPHRGAANVDGAVLEVARQQKERTHPELVGPNALCRLVVLAGETGGRWSEETRTFVGLLAKAKAREAPSVLRKRVEQSWWFRWGSLLACVAARAFAASLLDLRVSGGADGSVPTCHEVLQWGLLD